MAKTEHYYIEFEPNCHYHVFNRAIDRKNMFTSEDNYKFFLRQYDKYLSPLVTTLSYALMGNHFHFGIKIKPEPDLTTFRKLSNLDEQRYANPHALVSHQFQRFFQSYSMAFNKQQKRVGSLIQTPFKRCAVDPDEVPNLIMYHHLNPVHHRFTNDFRTYVWTSYLSYLSHQSTKLPREDVLGLFENREKFIERHVSEALNVKNNNWVIED